MHIRDGLRRGLAFMHALALLLYQDTNLEMGAQNVYVPHPEFSKWSYIGAQSPTVHVVVERAVGAMLLITRRQARACSRGGRTEWWHHVGVC